MDKIKECDVFDRTDVLAVNLLQLCYTMRDILCKIKEVYCLDEPTNAYYRDNFRNTVIAAYCGCKKPTCQINPLVKKYKQTMSAFDEEWPKMGYSILL